MVKVYQSRNWLWARYVKEKLTEQEIASLANTSQATINRWLFKFGLKK